MIVALLAALAAAGLGLCLRRTAAPVARLSGFVVAVGFAVVGASAPSPQPVVVAPRPATAQLAGVDRSATARDVLTATAVAAAHAGPRGAELTLRWTPAATDALRDTAAPGAALGAVAVAPPPLPFEPEQLQLRCVGECAVARPLQLELSCPPLSAPATAELRVRRGEVVVSQQVVQLGVAATGASFVPADPGPHQVELVAGLLGHRLRWSGEFDVAPAAEVLVLERGELVAAALRAQGVRVRQAAALSEAREALDGVGAVVLAMAVPAATQTALVAAVGDGLGLFVTGPAFGDAQAPLRAVLPVRPLPVPVGGGEAATDGGGERAEPPAAEPAPKPEPVDEPPPRDEPIGATGEHGPVTDEPIEVDKHAVALVLVVDRSASMGSLLANGYSKMSYAKTSALRTATALAGGDSVGVVTFGNRGAGQVELPMTDATDLATVRAGIEKLRHAPEQTYLLSGLRLARQLLVGQKAAVKHVVVITDGEFVLDEGLGLSAEARHMRSDDRTTVSMISIVDQGADRTFLREAEKVTEAGGGQFLPLTDPSVVPAMVSAEVTRALAKVGRKPRGDGDGPPSDSAPPRPEPPQPEQPPPPPVEPPPAEQTSLPVYAVAESPLLAPDPVEWPRVAGVVRCEAPFDARVLLVAGDDGWPLLAYANRGLGRVGALAADLAFPAMPLRDAAAFPAWLAQWVRAVAPSQRAADARSVPLAVEVAPPAPTVHDLAWLSAASAAPVAEQASSVSPAKGAGTAPQFAAAAPGLLVALLLLAMVERAVVVWSVRRGRSS